MGYNVGFMGGWKRSATVLRETVEESYDADRRAAADIDALEELADEIATLAAHIHAATHRLLVLIAKFDRLKGWEAAGYANCAQWLHVRTGIALGAAREKVRAARALESLPLTGAAMARGELSFSKVRALTRVATTENEGDLLDLARGATTDQLERMVRGWKKGSRKDELEWERERHASRTFSVFPDDDGMYVVRGRLTPEVGALLMRTIEAASDALFHERWVPGTRSESEMAAEAAERRADAVGLMAERALAAGFGGERCRCGDGRAAKAAVSGGSDTSVAAVAAKVVAVEVDGAEVDAVEGDVALVDAAVVDAAEVKAEEAHASDELNVSAVTSLVVPDKARATPGRAGCRCSRAEAPISGTRAERYQVVLHVEPATLSADGEPGRSELEDGTRVSAETSRRLSCDAGLVRVEHDKDGSVLDVGRRTRSIPPAVRRALEARDRGCRFPGCGRRFTDAHHVKHWADGGETSLRNCVLLCRFHHRLVHEGGWRIDWWGDGRPMFFNLRGDMRFDGRWEAPKLPDRPVETLIAEHARQGLKLDGWTAGASWQREVDIPDEVYFRASEGM